jgi:hypothetical protein
MLIRKLKTISHIENTMMQLNAAVFIQLIVVAPHGLSLMKKIIILLT